MTLDEAIKCTEKLAKEFKLDVEISITKYAKENLNRLADEYEQIAEWLKELKKLREENKVLTSECDRLIKEKGELLSKVSDGEICQLEEQIKDWKEEYAYINKLSYGYYKELKEAKRLLKSAIDEWNLVCEWGNCGEYCGWFKNGKCTQKWSGEAEALKLIGDEPNK